MVEDRRIARVITTAAAVLAALACLLPPVVYFSLAHQREAGAVEAEAELSAQLLDRVVTGNPELWRFEQARLADHLARRPRTGEPERRRVLDLRGEVVAESLDALPAPWVTRSFPLRDAGLPVGTIEIARSLRPIAFHALLFALVLVPVAFLAFQVLRTVPLRAVRRSERALRRQRDAAQRYLDVAAVAVVLLDARGRVSLVNRKGAEILARPAADILGQDWVEAFVPAAERGRVRRTLERHAGTERLLQLEHAVVRPSGEPRIVAWYLTSLAERRGGAAGFLVSGVDVTVERQLEEQLRHAQKMEAIGELASGVAHGFNNILSTIKSCAGQLRDELPAASPQLGDVDEILSAADRAAALTRSLLTFSRQRRGEPEPVDLATLVRGSERTLRQVLRPGVDLDLALGGEPLPVRVDALQIEQVLLNLVANARDAMPAGGRIALSVSRAELDAAAARRAGLRRPGTYAQISVADGGVGIAPEDQARVFEPFFTTKEVGKGIGLGLSLAYGIMRQHDGAIAVESEPGRGSTFTLLVPVREAPEDAARPGAGTPQGERTVEAGDLEAPPGRVVRAGRGEA